MTIKAVIFDIGNVLIEWQPERRFDNLIGADRRRAFFQEFDFFTLMDQIDEGAHFGDTIEAAASATPDWADEIRILRDQWCDLAQPAIDHSVRLLRALRTKAVPVFVLSNFGAQNFPLSEAQFPFLTEFDRRYISGEMGLKKPDPAIYAAVEADCGIAPEALFFADDRRDNLEAAQASGWQTHLFTGADGWADCLVGLGLLTRNDAR